MFGFNVKNIMVIIVPNKILNVIKINGLINDKLIIKKLGYKKKPFNKIG